jgi:hypothetical protein
MDVIENATAGPGSGRRTAVWVAVALAVLAGLYGLRRVTEARQPAAAPPAERAVTTTPTTQLTFAPVPRELTEQATQALLQYGVSAAFDVVGSNYANGGAERTFEDDVMGGIGPSEVLMTCVGTGGTNVSLVDPVNPDQLQPLVRLECTGAPTTATVDLSDGRLQFVMRPDPETVASFAYVVTTARH